MSPSKVTLTFKLSVLDESQDARPDDLLVNLPKPRLGDVQGIPHHASADDPVLTNEGQDCRIEVRARNGANAGLIEDSQVAIRGAKPVPGRSHRIDLVWCERSCAFEECVLDHPMGWEVADRVRLVVRKHDVSHVDHERRPLATPHQLEQAGVFRDRAATQPDDRGDRRRNGGVPKPTDRSMRPPPVNRPLLAPPRARPRCRRPNDRSSSR